MQSIIKKHAMLLVLKMQEAGHELRNVSGL